MRRLRAAAVLALLALAACSRPPKGMTRLDSGADNHAFGVDHAKRRLYYVEGGGSFVTKLGVVDLETKARSEYRLPHQKIVAFLPSLPGAVTVATIGTGTDNDGEWKLLLVEGATGKIVDQEVRTSFAKEDLTTFPKIALSKNATDIATTIVGGARPGVRSRVLRENHRDDRFFPTETEPVLIVSGDRGMIYAAYETLDNRWLVEQLNTETGARLVAAEFADRVESMAAAGVGVAVLHLTSDGSGLRKLAMVNAQTAHVDLELPWTDRESSIIAADTPKHLLYVVMDEGDAESCWAVHFDEPALRAASEWLSRNRGAGVRKLMSDDLVALGMLAGALVFFGFVMVARQGMD